MVGLYLVLAFIVSYIIIKLCKSEKKRGCNNTQKKGSTHLETICDTVSTVGNDSMASEVTDEEVDAMHNSTNCTPNPTITQTQASLNGAEDTQSHFTSSQPDLKSEHGLFGESNANQRSTDIEKQIRTILSSYPLSEQDDFITAIKQHPIHDQLLLVEQMKTVNLYFLHIKYTMHKMLNAEHIYFNSNYNPSPSSITQEQIPSIGVTKWQNAIEQYRDTDYFGVTNQYDCPKWQEDIDDYEQYGCCTYFLM